MQKTAKKFISRALSVITLMLCISSSNAFAKTTENNAKNLQNSRVITEDLTTFFKQNNIPISKQKILTEKKKKGIPWDCENPEKIKLMPEDFNKFTIDDKVKERVYTFEDGSFIEIAIEPGEVIENAPVAEAKSLEIGTNSIISDSFGTLYRNHKVSKQVGTTYAYFYANFYVSNYDESIIYTSENSNNMYNSPYGEGASGFGLTDNPSKEMIRDKEYMGQAALFRLYWFNQVEVSGEWAGISGSAPIGSTCNLYLALYDHSMYVASQLPF